MNIYKHRSIPNNLRYEITNGVGNKWGNENTPYVLEIK